MNLPLVVQFLPVLGVLVCVVLGANAQAGVSDKRHLPWWNLGFIFFLMLHFAIQAVDEAHAGDKPGFYIAAVGGCVSLVGVIYRTLEILKARSARLECAGREPTIDGDS